MAFTVEDGSIVEGANSLCTVAFADDYHATRGNAAWAAAASTAVKQYALIRATSYLSANFRGRWKGYKVLPTQRLEWPRTGCTLDDTTYYGYPVPIDEIPEAIQEAVAELALRSLSADGTSAEELVLDLEAGGGDIKRKNIAGVVDTEYFGAGYTQNQYTYVDQLISPYLDSSSSVSGVIERS